MPATIKMYIGNHNHKSPVLKTTASNQPLQRQSQIPIGINGSMLGRIHNARAGCGCGK
jgi:hypothetical protein